MRNYWMGEIGRHYDQQLSVSAVNSAKAGQDLAGQGMATAAANGDMAGFSLNVENMMKGAMREGAAKGWTQEEYDAKFGDIRSIATKQWVESRAVTDPAGRKNFSSIIKMRYVAMNMRNCRGWLRHMRIML
jgi:hypothetical protein